MDWFEHIDIAHSKQELSVGEPLLLLGSCFADHMAEALQKAYWPYVSNPFGTLYNPLSVLKALQLMQITLEQGVEKAMQQVPFQRVGERWVCWAFHGRFEAPTQDELLAQVRDALLMGAKGWQAAKTVILTFGSAFVYRLQSTGEVVGNCHKVSAERFAKERLTVAEIVEPMQSFLNQACAQSKRFILTVSPIRHKADGYEANQLSKATLLLAVNALTANQKVEYFPAYEIMMDELRDYRFYAADRLHPSPEAVAYIWERFCATYLSPKGVADLKRLNDYYKAAHHRSLHPNSPQDEAFHLALARQKEALQAQFKGLTLDDSDLEQDKS